MSDCSLTLQDDFKISPGDIRGSVEILKDGRMFMNSLPGGEIPCNDMGGLGFYYADTRFLNCLEMRVQDTKPVFLSRTLRDSHFAQVEMTNNEFSSQGQLVPLQTIHIRLLRMVKDGFYQRIRVINFNQCPVDLSICFKLGADFADIFEVRGSPRQYKGEREETTIAKQKVLLNYLGRDKLRRSTQIDLSPAPQRIIEKEGFVFAEYKLHLEPKKKNYIYLKITPCVENQTNPPTPDPKDLDFTRNANYLIASYQAWKDDCLQITSDNERFNNMVRVGITDLRALSTHYPEVGTVLEAGIPWYAAPFGRDALITAWQTLLVNPILAKNTLRYMAKYQGQEVNSWRDEQPGKIMHEHRFGEMASAGEIPHTPYYGSVDSTLWFIIVLADYIRWTDDQAFLTEMAEPLKKALNWCEAYGDLDKDGYIEYLCQSERGLVNQGWKDSWDGVIDRQGQIPKGSIALVEVQGYYFKALTEAAWLYELLKAPQQAEALRQRAKKLQAKFTQDFWLEQERFLAYFLDGQKRVIDTIVSNPGHCLFTGILSDQQAGGVINRLMLPDMFSGWGIRTMSDEEIAYNPMSYHNGTVWPHDNSIIGFGMRQYNGNFQLQKLVEHLFAASEYFDHLRLPELFCGFTRRGKLGPVKYPIACDPQAWAVGSMFLLLRALLGIECRGTELLIRNPHLPEFLQTLRLENIQVGSGKVSLEFARRHEKTYCGVISTEGNAKVIFQ